ARLHPLSRRRPRSACRTTLPNALCVGSLSDAAHGYSPAPTGAASARPRYTPSLPRRNSTASIHRPGLPTCCAASPIIRPPDCTSCCPGTGSYPKSPPLLPDDPPITALAGCLRNNDPVDPVIGRECCVLVRKDAFEHDLHSYRIAQALD